MSIITKIYDWAFNLAKKPYAEFSLYAISFIESIFLPIPTSVVLIPVILAQNKKWLRIICLTTITSVLGGVITYFIGEFFADLAYQLIALLNKEDAFEIISNILRTGDVLWIFLAAFTPLPFKIFALAFGLFEIDLITFIIISSLGRLAQFSLVGGIAAYLGANHLDRIRSIFSRIGWWILGIGIISFIVYKLI